MCQFQVFYLHVGCVFRLDGHHLRIQPVLDHIIAVMEDSFTRAAFGVDYSSVLLKDVLAVRKYWCEVSSEQWHSEYRDSSAKTCSY